MFQDWSDELYAVSKDKSAVIVRDRKRMLIASIIHDMLKYTIRYTLYENEDILYA